MAQPIPMDTLEASDTLQSVGFEKRQADTLIRIVNAQRQEIDLSHLATKEDLTREITAVKDDIAAVKDDIAAVKGDIAAVKGDIAAKHADIFKWMIGAIGAQTAIILAVIRLF